MNPELSFQNDFIKEFKARGWYAVHLSPPTCAGWVDVISIHSPFAIMAELKDFNKSDRNKKLKDLFTTAQFPRYIQQFGDGVGCIWLAFIDTTPEIEFDYYCVPIFDKTQLMSFWKMDVKTAISKMLGFISCGGMVKFMIELTEKNVPVFV